MKLESLIMKKMPVWVFLFIMIFVLAGCVMFGWLVKHALHGDMRLGQTGRVVLAIADFPSLVKNTFAEIGRGDKSPLLADNRFPEIDGFKKNGQVQQGAANDDGYLLLSAYDHSKGQSTVKLLRISDAAILHEWAPDIHQLKERQQTVSEFVHATDMQPSDYRMIHPLLLGDGSIVFKYRGPMFKVNACSEIEWTIDGVFHHSIEQEADGNFWVSSVIEPGSYDKVKFVGYRVMAYRISMMTGSGIVLTICTLTSWQVGYLSAAGLLGILFIYHVLLLPRVETCKTPIFQSPSINKKGWCASHAHLRTILDVILNKCLCIWTQKVFAELFHV